MSLSDAVREIAAVDVGRDVEVDAIMAQIRELLRATHTPLPSTSSEVPTIAKHGEAADGERTEDDFGQTVVRAIALLRRQTLDHQTCIDTLEAWIRSESEWNARSHQEVSARLDRLAASLEALASHTQLVGERLDQLERRLERELTVLRDGDMRDQLATQASHSEPTAQPEVSSSDPASTRSLLSAFRGRWKRFR
jgi:hypothetical protein